MESLISPSILKLEQCGFQKKEVFSISKLSEAVGVWPNLHIVLEKCMIYGKMYDCILQRFLFLFICVKKPNVFVVVIKPNYELHNPPLRVLALFLLWVFLCVGVCRATSMYRNFTWMFPKLYRFILKQTSPKIDFLPRESL